ncbi:MAG: hypothetical protein JXB42_11655 [Deltaproteobacteria bacterium]|nr:hypothetical protein [Deltaproteobacteria bacterium]
MNSKINQNGSAHIIIAIVVFLLLVGAWYTYHSWQSGNLKRDIQQIASEYKDLGNRVINKRYYK